MRRFYSLLVLAILTFVGGTKAVAEDVYQVPGYATGDYLTTITPGQMVVLQTASASGMDFLCGTGKASSLVKEAIYTFVEAGADGDGVMTYNIKQVFGDNYVKSGFYIQETTSQSDALRVYAKQAENLAGPGESLPDGADPSVSGTYTSSYANGAPWGAFIFAVYGNTSNYLCAYWKGYQPFVSGYNDTNTWYVYEVVKAEGYSKLQSAMEDLFPGGAEVSDYFTEGNEAGQLPTTYYQALVTAYTNAQNLLNLGEETADPSECEAATVALQEAYQAATENTVSLAAGYYLFRVNHSDGISSRTDASYAYSDGSLARWQLEWERGGSLSDADVAYIWRLEAVDGVKDGYKFYNFGTGKYIGSISGNSKAIPMAEEGATYIIKPQSGYNGYFTIALEGTTNSSMHAAVAGYAIVNYLIDSGGPVVGSGWAFEPVSNEDVEALEEAAEKAILTQNMTALVADATRTIADSYARKSYVTDPANLWTNALETTEGSIANALDKDYGTYFHSIWSSTTSVEYHNFCAELSEAVEEVTIQIVRRIGANNDCSPKDVKVYASNDVLSGDTDGADWVEIGDFTFTYDTDIVYNGTTYSNYQGHLDLTFDEPYKFIRFDVTSTPSGQKTNGNLHFNFAEIAYLGPIDIASSPISMIDEEIVQALNTALGNAQTELENDACTQETYDALEAALNNFKNSVPDIDALRQAVAKTKTYIDAMVEGTTIGYFKEGSKTSAQAEIEAIETALEGTLTAALIEQLEERLYDLSVAVKAALILPTDGEYYRFICRGSTSDGNYLYANGNGETTIKWGGKEDADKTEKLQYIWKAIVNEDGDIAYQNAFTGEYMGVYAGSKASDAITMTAEPAYIQMLSAGADGKLYFQQDGEDSNGNTFVANTQPSTMNLVTWYEGDANSYFEIQEAAALGWSGAQYLETGDTNAHIFTLPFDVAYADGAVLYQVIGILNGSTLELEEISEVEAGTPFIAVSEMEDGFYVYLNASNVEELSAVEYATTPGAVNGLIGVLAAYEAEGNEGKIADGIVKEVAADETIGPNTGYLSFGATPKTDTAGDLSIELDEAITTGIAQAVTDALNGKKVIYDLSGRRVNNAEKGVFIINGKKVIK